MLVELCRHWRPTFLFGKNGPLNLQNCDFWACWMGNILKKVRKPFHSVFRYYISFIFQTSSPSVYITYYKEEDAVKAILALNQKSIDGKTLRASLGTTKYCSCFLQNKPCQKSVSFKFFHFIHFTMQCIKRLQGHCHFSIWCMYTSLFIQIASCHKYLVRMYYVHNIKGLRNTDRNFQTLLWTRYSHNSARHTS